MGNSLDGEGHRQVLSNLQGQDGYIIWGDDAKVKRHLHHKSRPNPRSAQNLSVSPWASQFCLCLKRRSNPVARLNRRSLKWGWTNVLGMMTRLVRHETEPVTRLAIRWLRRANGWRLYTLTGRASSTQETTASPKSKGFK